MFSAQSSHALAKCLEARFKLSLTTGIAPDQLASKATQLTVQEERLSDWLDPGRHIRGLSDDGL